MIPVALDATNHDILQASCHEKWHKIDGTGKLSVSYQHMRRVWQSGKHLSTGNWFVSLNPVERKVVVFIIETNLSYWAGGERTVVEYASRYDSSKFDVIILEGMNSEFSRKNEDEILKHIPQVKIVRVDNSLRKFDFLFRFKSLHLGTFLHHFIVKNVLDVLHDNAVYKHAFEEIGRIHVAYLFSNPCSSYLKKSKCRVIGSNHGENFKSIVKTKLINMGLLYRRIDSFHIFPSNSTKIETLGKVGSFLLPNGISFINSKKGIFRANNKSANVAFSGKIRFLYVGRLEKGKGVLKLIKAWKGSDFGVIAELLIVGTGKLEKMLRNGIIDGISIVGSVSDSELNKIYDASDIFVFPTASDTFGLVVLEALSHGLYVLCSEDLRGTFDEFERIGRLKYFNPSVTILRKEMKASIVSADDTKRMVDKTSNLIEEKYSWDTISKELYDKLLELVS